MITLREYLKNHDPNFLTIEIQRNIDDLIEKLNLFRTAYGRPMVVTSGLRSRDEHAAIYVAKGVDPKKIPWGSKHLSGQACDFADPDGSLKEWVKRNENFVLNSCKLWAEHYDYTNGWLHLQSVPYGSWKPGKSLWFFP